MTSDELKDGFTQNAYEFDALMVKMLEQHDRQQAFIQELHDISMSHQTPEDRLAQICAKLTAFQVTHPKPNT